MALEQTIEFIRETIAAQTNGEKIDQIEPEICINPTVPEKTGVTRLKRKKNFVGIIGPGSVRLRLQTLMGIPVFIIVLYIIMLPAKKY